MESNLHFFFEKIIEDGYATYRPETASLNPTGLSLVEIENTRKTVDSFAWIDLSRYIREEHRDLLYTKRHKNRGGSLRIDVLIKAETVDFKVVLSLFEVKE